MSSHENLPPTVMRLISREIKKLALSPPAGVRFMPNPEENISEIFAELDGPADTPFEGGTFTVKLVIGRDFPAAPPKGYFLTKIYHPNVSNAGEICVNTLKRDWKPDLGICHVLKVIWCLLVVPFPESSLNDEAGKLFMDSYAEFARKAKLMTSIHAMKKSQAAAAAAAAGSKGGKKKKKSAACGKKLQAARMDAHFPSKKRSSLPNSKAKKTVAAKRKDRRAIQRKKSLKRL